MRHARLIAAGLISMMSIAPGWVSSTSSEQLPLPEPAEVLAAAELYLNEGPDALDALPFFSQVIPFGSLNEASCGLVVPMVIRAVAYNVDPSGELGLLAEVNRRLAEPAGERRGPSVGDVLGEDWHFEVPELEEGAEEQPSEPMLEVLDRLESFEGFDSFDGFESLEEVEPLEPSDPAGPAAHGADRRDVRLAVQTPAAARMARIMTAAARPQAGGPMVGKPPIKLFFQVRDNAPTLFDRIPQVYAEAGPRAGFDWLCTTGMPTQGIDPRTELAYRVKKNFYIYYHFCGPRAITAQKTLRDSAGDWIAGENGSFTYKYPYGWVALIRKCTVYDLDCAPTHVQMIAADLVFAREYFKSAGFDLPAGGMLSVAPEIPVHITQNSERSTAHLGRMWLHRPLAEGGREMRWLAFHEYFHLVQFTHRADLSFVQAIHNWSAKPGDDVSWTAPPADLTMTSFFWGNLESMASWAADILIEDYPSWELSGNPWNDGRGYPFFNSYADLIYGYLAERFAGGGWSSMREMAKFVKGYLTPISAVTPYDGYKWAQIKYLELYLATKNLTVEQLVEDYHKDLLYSLYKESPEGGKPFRWSFLRKPGRAAWSWPPKFAVLPSSATLKSIGSCPNGVPMKKANARPLPSDPATLRVNYTCTVKMAAAGALHLKLPLDNSNLPGLITVQARAFKDHDPSQSTPAAPRIIFIPTAEGPKAGTDPNDFVAIAGTLKSSDRLLGHDTAVVSYGTSRRIAEQGLNAITLIVRYPDFWDRRKQIAEDNPNITVGGQKPYFADPIRMEVEIKGIW